MMLMLLVIMTLCLCWTVNVGMTQSANSPPVVVASTAGHGKTHRRSCKAKIWTDHGTQGCCSPHVASLTVALVVVVVVVGYDVPFAQEEANHRTANSSGLDLQRIVSGHGMVHGGTNPLVADRSLLLQTMTFLQSVGFLGCH